jgi:hypothetical protein
MIEHELVYLEIHTAADLKSAFREIREEIEHADSKFKLTELYNRAGYLIVLANDAFWERKFFRNIGNIRSIAEEEFRLIARKINHQAETIGLEGNYDETWAD